MVGEINQDKRFEHLDNEIGRIRTDYIELRTDVSEVHANIGNLSTLLERFIDDFTQFRKSSVDREQVNWPAWVAVAVALSSLVLWMSQLGMRPLHIEQQHNKEQVLLLDETLQREMRQLDETQNEKLSALDQRLELHAKEAGHIGMLEKMADHESDVKWLNSEQNTRLDQLEKETAAIVESQRDAYKRELAR